MSGSPAGSSGTASNNGNGNEDGEGNGNGNGNGPGWKSMKDALQEAKKAIERDMPLDKPEVLAEKKPPGTTGTTAVGQLKVLTNVHGMRLPKVAVTMYDVAVTAKTSGGKTLDMTGPTRDDYTMLLRKHLCTQTYAVLSRSAPFLGNKTYYNGQNVMYAVGTVAGDLNGTFTVNLADYELTIAHFESVNFSVKKSTKDASFDLSEVKSLMNDPRELDRRMLQFVDTATSQHALLSPDRLVQYENHKTYLLQPLAEGFQPADCPDLVEGKYVAIGSSKCAMAVEGPGGPGEKRVAVAVDTSKTAVHFQENVLSKALRLVPDLLKTTRLRPADLKFLRTQLCDLQVEKQANGASFVVKILNVSSENARTTKFTYGGKEVSVEQYYKVRHGVELMHPEAPLLVAAGKERGTFSYFPMELCYIVESQRVKGQQQTAAQLKQMRPVCIIPPASRVAHNAKNVAALHLHDDDNPFLFGAGIEVVKKPLAMDARLLPTPVISYGKGKTASVDLVKMWSIGRRDHYIFPSVIKKWVVFVIFSDSRTSRNEFTEFVSQLAECGGSHGMKIPEPVDIARLTVDKGSLEQGMSTAAREKCDYVLCIQSDDSTLHGALKELERKYQVPTQHVTLSKMKDVVNRGKWKTLENIVNKMNVKLGGLNYGVIPFVGGAEYIRDGRLFIGFSMSHPEPPTAADQLRGTPRSASVLGYAANCRKFNYEFIGDYGYQSARRADNLSLIEQSVTRIIEHYKKNRGCLPQEVIVYRSGVPEGQFATVLKYEIPLLRRGLRRSGCPEGIKVAFVVVTRLHNIRITPFDIRPQESTIEQNLKPGVVVDSRLVHPKYKEFYLNSHKALQGTAKTPRYTVLVDDLELSMDELELMTYSLCYCHQIVNLPTSTPTPLYVAMRYAERGRLVMLERYFPDASSSEGGRGRSAALNLDEMNDDLPLYGTKIANVRVNA